MENWRPIPNYPLYLVSDAGNVKSIYSTGVCLKPGDSFGYERIQLRQTTGGKQKHFFVHRLVLLAFVGACPTKRECNHKNGLKKDNRLENLEYVTRHYNQWHCTNVIKTRESQKGSKHGRSKINEKTALAIRAAREAGGAMQDIADKFNVCIATVSMIVNRKIWRHI
jgi:hypothetical protein